jgi:glycine cleavage system T protein (aminomethyltransferase)
MIGQEHFRRPLQPTPFTGRIAEINPRQAWTGWAGHLSATVLDSVEQEYFAIRNQATVYDISPLHKYRIAGPEAEAFLNRLVTRDVAKIAPGRVGYVLWCDDAGKVIDDGTLFRFAADEFRLCAQEPHLLWLEDSAAGFDVRIEEASAAVAGLSLQGPTSCAVLKALDLPGIERVAPFAIARHEVAGRPLAVSRTGFTGDLGYELWMAPTDATVLWDRLFEAGRPYGIRAIGWNAIDIARIEAGFLMVGHDFLPADRVLRPGRARSPFELGFDKLVDFGKGHFNGRRALLAERERGGGRWRMVGLDVAGNKPAENALVYHGRSREVGQVTSAAWSPTAKRNIALALIERDFADGSRALWADIYVQKELKWTRSEAPCRIVARPFWNPPRRSAVPAPEH